MNLKKLTLFALFVSLMLPILVVGAQEDLFTYQDRINTSNSVFFMNSMEEGDYIQVSLSAGGEGIFGVFLFHERPMETYVNFDRSIDPQIYDKAIAYEIGSVNFIEYTANASKIYYLQIILIEKGPDFYFIQCNRELSRYYLPLIPGYPLEILVFSSIFAIGMAYIMVKRRAKTLLVKL